MINTLLIWFIAFFNVQTSDFLFEFGNFENAVSISYSETGIVYVLDEGKNEISSYTTGGKEILKIGGYGSGEESFDSPSDLFATPLNLYIADKNNDRIVFYDKDMNYLSEMNSDNYDNNLFAYPSAVAVSYQGDFFVLDSDNQRVLKFDLNGNYLTQIGNFDSGRFYLTDPQDLIVTKNGELVVLQDSEIFFFDFYGNGLRKYKPEIEIERLNYSDGHLLLIGKKQIELLDFRNGQYEKSIKHFDSIPTITDAIIINDKLFVSTGKHVEVYKFEE